MGWIIGKGIGIPFRTGGGISWQTYWSHQSEVLFFGLYSEISGGQMPNKVLGATDYLTVAGVAGSETYQCPNTADYIAADTDYIWFKTDATQRAVTTAELIGYDLQRTPVKYLDDAPNSIEAIIILSSAVTGTKRDRLFADMCLSPWWDDAYNDNGHIKSNRAGAQILWTVENTSEVEAYITGLTTPLSTTEKNLLNGFVSSIKKGIGIANFSDFFDCAWLVGGETKEVGYKNLTKDAHHVTASAEPTWTQFLGSQGNGTDQFLNLNYTPSTEAENFKQNDGAAGILIMNNVNEAKADMGLVDTGTKQTINLMHYSGTFYGRINVDAAASDISSAQADSRGLWIATRNGAATGDISNYYNKTTIGTKTGTGVSQTLLGASVYLGALHRTIPSDAAILHSTRQYGFAFISKHVTTAIRDVIFDALKVYVNAHGVNII